MPDTVLVKMTRAEADLWEAFKAMLREQAGRTPLTVPAPGAPDSAPTVTSTGLQPGVCGAPGYKKGLVCRKQKGHGQRHRYEQALATPEHLRPVRAWIQVDSFIKQSGSKGYTIKSGYPCRVEGQRGQWKVLRIEQHAETGAINVEVTADRTGHSRIFTADKVIYKRPKVAR